MLLENLLTIDPPNQKSLANSLNDMPQNTLLFASLYSSLQLMVVIDPKQNFPFLVITIDEIWAEGRQMHFFILPA
jgi:hypothetical protein